MMDEESRSSHSVGQAVCQSDRRASSSDGRIRQYSRSEAVVFLKTREEFGGLSNMAAGFPLCVNGIEVRTSEALYQACRFPHLPDIQREILEQRSPMTAKMKSKPHRAESRPNWDQARIKVMRWCLRLKLAQNWEAFAGLLESTGDRPIVEDSRRDDFWGAKPVGEDELVGMNILGRLLMELRGEMRDGGPEAFLSVAPPSLNNFRLLGAPVRTIVVRGASIEPDRSETEQLGATCARDESRSLSPLSAAVPPSMAGGPREDADLIARLRWMVWEHPLSRQEINAALNPLLPSSLPKAQKSRTIRNHLRRLQRAGWIAFHKPDQRWRAGDRRALPDLRDPRVKRGRTARYA